MNYDFDIVTPANTAEGAPLVTRRRVAAGVIKQVEIYFPPGAAGLLHLRINHGNHQILPYNQDGNFTGDNVLIRLPEDIPINKQSWHLNFITWNESEYFSHSVSVRLSILREETPPSWVKTLMELLLHKSTFSARDKLANSSSGIQSWLGKITGGDKNGV